MENNMKKAFLILIALILAISSFTACQSGDKPDDPAAESSSAGGSNESGNQESGDQTPAPTETEPDMGIPDGLDYEDNTVQIFHWLSGTTEFDVDVTTMTGEPVEDAVYKRNLYTEEKLNVELEFTGSDGQRGKEDAFCNAIKNRTSDPSTPVDIIASYARTTATAAISGLLFDLNQLDNLDLEKEWWPKNVQEEYNVRDRLYFLSGDISTSLLNNMSVIFYNTDMITARGFDDPIHTAIDGDWTLDKMIEMTQNSYEDIDDASGKSDGDIFGLSCRYWYLDSMYQAHGYKIVTKAPSDSDSILKYSDELFGPVVESWIGKMQDWLCSNIFIESEKSTDMFKENRLLFQLSYAYFGQYYRDTDIKYSILPLPKLDSQQEDYISSPGNTFTLYGICNKSPDIERAAATLQVMGYYAQELTTPALFDVTLKGRYSKNEDMFQVWDIIGSTISFDMGRLFQAQLSAPEDMITMAIVNNTNWATVISPFGIKAREKLLRNINLKFENVIESE